MKNNLLPRRVRTKLAKRIKHLRQENGNMSYTDIFFTQRISQTTMSKLEAEQLNPTLGMLLGLAKVFNLTLVELLEGIE